MLRTRRFQGLAVVATGLVLIGGVLLTGQARQGAPAGRGTAAAPAPAGQRPASRGPAGQTGRPVRVLFLGMDEERPHNPARMFPHLAAPLARLGVQLTYVADQAQALDPEKLKYYDVLMIYGNQTALTPAQETALVSLR